MRKLWYWNILNVELTTIFLGFLGILNWSKHLCSADPARIRPESTESLRFHKAWYEAICRLECKNGCNTKWAYLLFPICHYMHSHASCRAFKIQRHSMHSDVVVQAILISLLAICVFGLGSDLVKLVWEKLFGTKKDKEKKEKKEKKAGVFVACFSWFFHVQKERPGFFPTMPIQGSIVAFGVPGCRGSLWV